MRDSRGLERRETSPFEDTNRFVCRALRRLLRIVLATSVLERSIAVERLDEEQTKLQGYSFTAPSLLNSAHVALIAVPGSKLSGTGQWIPVDRASAKAGRVLEGGERSGKGRAADIATRIRS